MFGVIFELTLTWITSVAIALALLDAGMNVLTIASRIENMLSF